MSDKAAIIGIIASSSSTLNLDEILNEIATKTVQIVGPIAAPRFLINQLFLKQMVVR